MLDKLHVENYVLVDCLDLSFGPGLSVITGETGAGKSVLMGAIGLILGQRADLKMIKDGHDRCVLEAEFSSLEALEPFFRENDLEYDPAGCVVRRELYASGKSRAFVNDSPVTQAVLKDLGSQLMDIHSQHENLLLGKDRFQLDLVDMVAGSRRELAQWQSVYHRLTESRRELSDLEERLRLGREEKDYIAFQFKQLDEARLTAGEQAALESEQELLTHTEEIKSGLEQLEQLLSDDDRGICPQLRTALNTAGRLGEVFPQLKEACSRLNTSWLDLNDLRRDIDRWDSQVDVDPARLEVVEERLSLLFDLQQKHRVHTVEELIEIRERLAARLGEIELGDDRLEAARRAVREAEAAADEAGKMLTKARRRVTDSIESYMITQLQQLGMPHVQFQVDLRPKPMDASGCDRAVFLFSANKNVAVQPLSEIASGGEVSRVMLCLKALIADVSQCSTLLFDEIDTGVSGEIAHRMGCLMQEIARHRQVLCITHLPQIAAKGASHYKVYKSEDGEQAISRARLLSGEEREREIASMLSGEALSEAALNNARQLIYGN